MQLFYSTIYCVLRHNANNSFKLSFSLQTTASPQDWQRIKRPIPATDGKANPIGSYSNGCIIGAEPLPYKGEGYQVIRMNKNRYYGHPDMIAYLQRLGQKAKSAGLPTMLVGDIAMPGGGRFLTGHASHQMGLDADIWLRMGTMTDSEALNSDGKGLLVVNRQTQRVDENVWNNNHATLIKLAAQDPKVTRIFVNPAIKLKLCQTAGDDRAWLHKIHTSTFALLARKMLLIVKIKHLYQQAMVVAMNFILGLNLQNQVQDLLNQK